MMDRSKIAYTASQIAVTKALRAKNKSVGLAYIDRWYQRWQKRGWDFDKEIVLCWFEESYNAQLKEDTDG